MLVYEHDNMLQLVEDGSELQLHIDDKGLRIEVGDSQAPMALYIFNIDNPYTVRDIIKWLKSKNPEW